jgi:uncharacterized protein YegL
MDKLDKTETTTLKKSHTVSLTGLRARLAIAKKQQCEPSAAPNRIALMLDVSGSMAGAPIEKLKDASTSFIQHCNSADTALGLRTFPKHSEVGEQPLSCDYAAILAAILGQHADNGTPMADAMQDILYGMPITRAVMVSDGAPNDTPRVYELAHMYQEAQIPIDCVHIGHSSSGEDVLQKVAEITGGKFIKFTDIASFAGAFKYLTPGLYGMLTSGAISAQELGAREIK